MASRRQISVGGIAIGGGAPVSIQSMTTTKTYDVEATLEQVGRLREAGVDIVRVAVPGIPDADALPAIVEGAGLPIIADIHFNASLALRAMDTGVAAVRINPGNIGGAAKVESVVRKAQATSTPLRIGANSARFPITCAREPPPIPPERSWRRRWRRSSCWSALSSTTSKSRSSRRACPR